MRTWEQPYARKVARRLLAAHDVLTKVSDVEPERNGDGDPVDGPAWLEWDKQQNRPARAAVAELVEHLADVLDADSAGAHELHGRHWYLPVSKTIGGGAGAYERQVARAFFGKHIRQE
ncbi:hypothetical protein ACFRAQ_34770 [Nocardia sp. NPDC056611]|uniref:hypothetical protein n=1 Tax=Nocardia sp. NPDC056611 TaxID=3345877 RepID=UPI00366D5DB6